MGNYLIPLAAAEHNIVVAKDGSVWANYLLRGINVNPYDTSTIAAGQKQNEMLFQALSELDTNDVLITGVKVRIHPDEIASRIVQGIKKITSEQYPKLLAHVSAFHQKRLHGQQEYRRVYVMSVKVPSGGIAPGKGALAKAGGIDPLKGLDWNDIRKREAEILGRIPASFSPSRTTPDHLSWLHDRMRLRGLEVPCMPHGPQRRSFNAKGFSAVMINKTADSDIVVDQFLDAVDNGDVPKVRSTKLGQFRANYRSIRFGQALAVYSPEQRSDHMPDGPAAFQTLMGVEEYPVKETDTINTFTYLVDQDLGVDADFALRLSFTQKELATDHARSFKKVLGQERTANSQDEFDDEGYDDRHTELGALRATVRKEAGPRGMKVAAIFAFADASPKVLRAAISAIRNKFESNNFKVTFPVGGQFDLLEQMMPGSTRSRLSDDLQQLTTVRSFSACMPVRRTEIGDSVGIPIAINKENALGQIVHQDFLNATEDGNGSMAITGAQGGGKSYIIKVLLEWFSDLQCPTTIIDHSPHGEYEVFATQLAGAQVLRIKEPTRSLCPLKVFSDDLTTAHQVYLETMCSLFGISHDDPMALLLSEVTAPKSRELRGINSSRGVMAWLVDKPGEVAERLLSKMQYWAGQRYARALFDPISNAGTVDELPAFVRSREVRSVIFRTNGLQLHRGELTEDLSPEKRYAQVIYTLIARITAYDYARIRGLCVFAGDEMSFTKGSRVVEDLVRAPGVSGRKEGNIGLFGSQAASHFDDENYGLISRKLVLKQQTQHNIVEAFGWADIPPTPGLIRRMRTDTSPSLPDERGTIPGREGEGWYNDGRSIARIQTLPFTSESTGRFADTRASKMIRAEELSEAQASGVRG
ncbi:MAG: hypothetical protein ACJA07_000480 [Rhodococcus sp. (in: high G+C Gram-positive bacteria)]|jgi:hypothetical protein